MEVVTFALLGLTVGWGIYAGWQNHRLSTDLRRAMEMLAARSFGEFAAGKAKLDGTTPAATEWNPDF